VTTAVTPTRSAPTERITRDDLERKFRQLKGDVTETARSAQKTIVTVGVAVAVGVIVASFLLGRRRGKRQRTVVEIRRV
jgi:uncharacterized membrane protein affecting hemolysin expression